MKSYTISLKHGLKKILILSISVFLTVQILITLALFTYNTRTNQAYIQNNVSKTVSNLNNYLGQIEKNGFSISSNSSFMTLYADKDTIMSDNAFTNAYQTAAQICTLTPGILDLTVIDLNGTKKSFFSAYDYNIVDSLDSQKILSTPSNLDRRFYFFPNDSDFSKNYFLYYFPIFTFGTSPVNAQKSATAVFICSKQELNNYLMPEKNTSTVLSLYYKDILLSSSSPDADADSYASSYHKPFTQMLQSSDMQVKGISASLFAFQKITVLICVYLLIIIICFIMLLLFINRWIHRYITIPITDITTQLRTFNSGDLNKRITFTNVEEINDIATTANEMIENIKAITKKIFTTQDQLYETVLRKTEAELYALQSQINPHFLYNTLQCIRGLATLKRTEDIKEITISMADVFKYSIAPGTYVTFLEEIRIIHKYLSICKIRLNDKMKYEIDVDDDILQCYTVKMIIQPTVENAVVHAFRDCSKIPCINIMGHVEEDKILFRIIDNGNGIDLNILQEIRKKLSASFESSIKEKSSFGIGLYNINRRIKLAYGNDYGIEIFSNINGTEVDITIPYQNSPPPTLIE